MNHSGISFFSSFLGGSHYYLHDNKDKLYHREGYFNSWITVKVSHITSNLENVHNDTEDPKKHKST